VGQQPPEAGSHYLFLGDNCAESAAPGWDYCSFCTSVQGADPDYCNIVEITLTGGWFQKTCSEEICRGLGDEATAAVTARDVADLSSLLDAYPERLELNPERKSLQGRSCRGKSIVLNLELDPSFYSALVQRMEGIKK
jgi:hypothetical protein